MAQAFSLWRHFFTTSEWQDRISINPAVCHGKACIRGTYWSEPLGYPDPGIVAGDPRFRRYSIFNTPIQRLYTGTFWAEGPAWNGIGRYLVWSDIPNNVQHRWLEEDGHVSVLHNPAGFSNGNTFDYQGRQLSCEHGNRRVARLRAAERVSSRLRHAGCPRCRGHGFHGPT